MEKVGPRLKEGPVTLYHYLSIPSRDLTPNDGLVREMGPLISGKSRLVKYYNLAGYMGYVGQIRGIFGEQTLTSSGTLPKITHIFPVKKRTKKVGAIL